MPTYAIHNTPSAPLAAIDFSKAETGRLGFTRPESKLPIPAVSFRVLCDGSALYVRFDVLDRYVRSVQTELQSPVCTDSCVEFFVAPVAGKGYFNFEINAGGAMLLTHVEDPARTPTGLKKCTPLSEAACRQVEIRSSLPRVVEPERTEPTAWNLRYRIPFAIFEPYVGAVAISRPWRGNFYKCGDKTSHPHWLSWAEVPELNFHLPGSFGTLVFK